MIVRMWHGRVPAAKAAAYREFLNARAIPDYRSVPGNIGAQILERSDGDATHFITLTHWESLEAIRAFAGDDLDRAKYYPEDASFLLELEPTVVHYEVVGRSIADGGVFQDSHSQPVMGDSPPDSHFRVEQIDHVELFVPDRREAAAWYRRVLGLEAVAEYESWSEDPQGPLMISSDGGSTKLALFRGVPQASRPTAGFHLVAFRVSALAFAQFVERVSELQLMDHRGRHVAPGLVVDHGKAYSIYFSDPFGHRLELTTYEYNQASRELARLSRKEQPS